MPPGPPLPFVSPINTHYTSPPHPTLDPELLAHQHADSTLDAIHDRIAHGQLQEALVLYDQQRSSIGHDQFFSSRYAPWALTLANAYFDMGLAALPRGDGHGALQYLKTSFDCACDAILMYLGSGSAEYETLMQSSWFAESDHRFKDLCLLFSKPMPGKEPLEVASCRIVAARALFALTVGATQHTDTYAGLYDMSAHFWNAALTSLLNNSSSSLEAMYPMIFECRRMLALCYRRRRQYEWAWLVLEDGLRECKQADQAIQGVYWADIGALSLDARRFNAGIEAFERALRCRSAHATQAFRAHVLTGYAQCLGGMANAKGAVVAFQEAIECAKNALEKGEMSVRECLEIHATALDFTGSQVHQALVREDPEVEYIRSEIAASTDEMLQRWETECGGENANHNVRCVMHKKVLLDVDDLDIPMLRMGGRSMTAWIKGEYLKDQVLDDEREKHKNDPPLYARREGVDTLM
jgi:tetratricopeptide (TPR) repeat protein